MVRDGEALIRLRLRVVGCAERLCSLPLCHDGSTPRLVPAPPGRRLPSEVAPYREPGSAALYSSFGTSAACLSALAVAGGAFLFGDAFPARCGRRLVLHQARTRHPGGPRRGALGMAGPFDANAGMV